MNFIDTKIDGLYLIDLDIFKDERGVFSKIYNENIFKNKNIDIKESYFSISKKNVIRGMHFQIPPYEHYKIVYVPKGRINDVVLDIREGSPTYGDFFDIEISSINNKAILIPAGLAHGFISLEDDTNVTYLQTSVYSSKHDEGILYNSFKYDWGIGNHILSKRDLSFKTFEEFSSPFIYTKEKI